MTSPNNIKHISDAAKDVDFNPSGTNFPEHITNVQTALASIGGYAIESVGLPQATKTSTGVVELATVEEMEAGLDEVRVPAVKVVYDFIKKPAATESVVGTIRIATTDEAKAGVVKDAAITPNTLDTVFSTRQATEARMGTSKIATTDQARAGVVDTVMMTPAKTKQAIDALVAKVATATESNPGVVQLATTAQVQAGAIREGFAISPYQFAHARGTASAYGTFKAAQDADCRTNWTATDKAVTPWVLGRNKGATDKYGIVALSTTVRGGLPNHALAANAAVLPTTGGEMSGTISFRDTGHGVRWNFNTDSAWITFHSRGDSDPDTRMEFAVSDNNTEYFRWVSNATAGGGAYEMMRLRPAGPRHKADLMVNGYIYTNGTQVYSNNNKPHPHTIGAMIESWGGTQWTGYVNSMDGVLNYEVPHHHVMVGLYSYHNNKTEDRQWRVKYKRIG